MKIVFSSIVVVVLCTLHGGHGLRAPDKKGSKSKRAGASRSFANIFDKFDFDGKNDDERDVNRNKYLKETAKKFEAAGIKAVVNLYANDEDVLKFFQVRYGEDLKRYLNLFHSIAELQKVNTMEVFHFPNLYGHMVYFPSLTQDPDNSAEVASKLKDLRFMWNIPKRRNSYQVDYKAIQNRDCDKKLRRNDMKDSNPVAFKITGQVVDMVKFLVKKFTKVDLQNREILFIGNKLQDEFQLDKLRDNGFRTIEVVENDSGIETVDVHM